MSKSVNVMFTVIELKRMIEQAEKHNSDLVDVIATPTGIGTNVKVKAENAKDFVDVTDYDSW